MLAGTRDDYIVVSSDNEEKSFNSLLVKEQVDAGDDVRIESDSVKSIYDDFDQLKKNYKIVEFDDYIKNPLGDYRSLHAIVEVDGKFSEIQLPL